MAKARPAKSELLEPQVHFAQGDRIMRVALLAGCAQQALDRNINAATIRILQRHGCDVIVADGAGCCGALPYHLSEHDEARTLARRNIDGWWPLVESGAEAIVMTASGCGVMLRDYGHILAQDPAYAAKAAKIAALVKDPVEIVAAEWRTLVPQLAAKPAPSRLAFHPPCTLQHGFAIRGEVERLLADAGYALVPVADAHLCCGSAGTYSILQPALSRQLRDRKLAALQGSDPVGIVTANIGCLVHLQAGARVPVAHWIELLDETLQA